MRETNKSVTTVIFARMESSKIRDEEFSIFALAKT